MRLIRQNILLATYVILTVLVFYVAFVIYINLNSEKTEIKRTKIIVKSGDCKIQFQECEFVIENSRLKVSSDKTIKYLHPFSVLVKTPADASLEIEKIQIDFLMTNMDMGINRFLFNKSVNKKNNQTWKAKALLPICVTGRADWVAELRLFSKDKIYYLKLPVTVEQPGL